MTEVYLALGSNVGDSRQYIGDAISLLDNVLTDIKQAPLYTSRAVGYTDQPDFINTAVSGYTDLRPEELLEAKDIEQRLGRVERFRWGPREIDIDIIFYSDMVLESAQLTIPHPRYRDRDFVLQPICDLNPQLTDPISGQTICQLLAQLGSSQKSIRPEVDGKA